MCRRSRCPLSSKLVPVSRRELILLGCPKPSSPCHIRGRAGPPGRACGAGPRLAKEQSWKKSADLLFTLLLSDTQIFVNKELLFEYEKYINKILGMPHLFLPIQRRSILIDPSMDSLRACRPFFPENEFADAVHAATCIEAEAILISNDAHFDEIRESGLIEVWKISKAIGKIL